MIDAHVHIFHPYRSAGAVRAMAKKSHPLVRN